jgi:hypothetical protein
MINPFSKLTCFQKLNYFVVKHTIHTVEPISKMICWQEMLYWDDKCTSHMVNILSRLTCFQVNITIICSTKHKHGQAYHLADVVGRNVGILTYHCCDQDTELVVMVSRTAVLWLKIPDTWTSPFVSWWVWKKCCTVLSNVQVKW